MGDKHWANTLKHTVEQTLIESKRKTGLVGMVDDIFNQLDDFARQPPSQPKGRQVVKRAHQRRSMLKSFFKR
jgi:flagellar hook-associated protein FlgK